ncbi:MAG: HK97 gp10 family phage protein [Bacteroidales bacterium]|nr:HK97 gp10 family phage protein [Bacteroidales bacterium]
MGMEIHYENNFDHIRSAFNSAEHRALEECGLTAEGYAQASCPVDTGNLRNSITHEVEDHEVAIGTNCEYAPYVELGTGIYYSGGRQDPWVYQDSKGNWHLTNGMEAQPYLKPAVADHTDTYKNIIESEFQNG